MVIGLKSVTVRPGIEGDKPVADPQHEPAQKIYRQTHGLVSVVGRRHAFHSHYAPSGGRRHAAGEQKYQQPHH